MAVALITIFVIFFWFLGGDLINFVRDEYSRTESRALHKLGRAPSRNFLKNRAIVEPVLHKHFEYYRLLPEFSKLKFLYRCNSIIREKQFVAREELEITDDMRILVSGSIVQLTFGLDHFSIPHFDTFIIYPSAYTSPHTGALHRGETSMRGHVVFSWQHFIEGYSNSKDKLNLGLHELAHALDLSRIVKQSDPDFYEYFLKWQAGSTEVFNEVNNTDEHFLRKYAGTDEREFFSVCVEHFFEDSHGFKATLPDLYRQLTMLLRQDPSMIGRDEHTKLLWDSNHPNLKEVVKNEKVKFKSDVQLFHATKWVLLPIGFYALLSIGEPETDWTLAAVFLSIVAFIGCIIFFYRFRIILVSDNFIFVYSPLLSSWISSYAIVNIISIRYDDTRSNGVLWITYLEKGNVLTNMFQIGMERSQYEKLKEAMYQKGVLMSF